MKEERLLDAITELDDDLLVAHLAMQTVIRTHPRRTARRRMARSITAACLFICAGGLCVLRLWLASHTGDFVLSADGKPYAEILLPLSLLCLIWAMGVCIQRHRDP